VKINGAGDYSQVPCQALITSLTFALASTFGVGNALRNFERVSSYPCGLSLLTHHFTEKHSIRLCGLSFAKQNARMAIMPTKESISCCQ